ncbi:hypothetical protein N7471_007668 [Penicillium samsonianum]|uniref:uncharacterized protein n=1 Tax=Penicillium samsonianum TaxID=1882272 RepID=UPI002546ACE9|nr:uncharacterized protein N7471_007668 [Penicillium samsonianum]KAJ6132453.1 hypothetical protein N7471_007668 [Penicillium samsonianum]
MKRWGGIKSDACWALAEREMRIVSLVNVQEAPIFDRPTLRPSGRSYSAPSSQKLAVVANSHGQPAERTGGIVLVFVPSCQPLGDHLIFSSPRGWLLLLKLVIHAGGIQAVVNLLSKPLRSPLMADSEVRLSLYFVLMP